LVETIGHEVEPEGQRRRIIVCGGCWRYGNQESGEPYQDGESAAPILNKVRTHANCYSGPRRETRRSCPINVGMKSAPTMTNVTSVVNVPRA
jgi:hypothetical protein